MKRIPTIILAIITIVSLSVCVVAFQGELTAALFIETADGSVFASNEVVIDGSANEYTFTFSGISVSNPAMIYIKDVNLSAAVTTSSFDMQVLVSSLKINGESVSLSPDYRTVPNAERFDFCYYNVNGASAIELNNESISDVELVISVKPINKPADTGIALCVLPLVAALVLTTVSKKR